MQKLATKGQRATAFIIDLLLVLLVTFLISTIILSSLSASGALAAPEMPDNVKELYDKYEKMEISYYEFQTELMSEENAAYVESLTTYEAGAVSTVAVSLLVVVFLYNVLLAYYWKHQTLGRLLMHIAVVDANLSRPSFATLALRELVGVYLFNTLLSVCCGVPIWVNIVLFFVKAPVHDLLSHTTIISLNENDKITDYDFNDQKPKEDKNDEVIIDVEIDDPYKKSSD